MTLEDKVVESRSGGVDLIEFAVEQYRREPDIELFCKRVILTLTGLILGIAVGKRGKKCDLGCEDCGFRNEIDRFRDMIDAYLTCPRIDKEGPGKRIWSM